MTVPLPGGKEAPMDHKSVDHTEKTLGTMMLPDGDSLASIRMIQEKAQIWINAVQNGHLHQRNVWFSLKVQFWPRIRYGLCSSTATFQELNKSLKRQYYQMLPLCGIVWSTPVGSRSVDAGFFGVGLPHLGVEALIAMLNELLMHYGCNTATGRFMWISYSLLYLKLGSIVSTDTRVILEVRPPHNPLVGEDVMGKKFIIQNSHGVCGLSSSIPMRRQSVYNASIDTGGVYRRGTPTPK